MDEQVFSMGENPKPQPSDPPLLKRLPTPAEASVLFSLGVLLLLTIGFKAQNSWPIPGLVITEFLLILLPTIVISLIRRIDMRRSFRLNKIKLSNGVIIFFAALFAMPLVSIINLGYTLLLKMLFGHVPFVQLPPASDWRGLLINLSVIGLSAALCEEVMFRGFVMRSLQGFGPKAGIFLSALLFGMFHLDLSRLLGTFLIGLLIGFFVHRTNSIFSGMLVHFTNNAFGVILLYVYQKAGISYPQNTDVYDFSKMSPFAVVASVVVYGALAAVFALLLAAMVLLLIKNTKKGEPLAMPAPHARQKKKLLWLLPGLSMVAFVYVYQAFSYAGVHIPWMKEILIFLVGK